MKKKKHNKKSNHEETLNAILDEQICGPSCQEQKKKDESKQKYLDAQNNLTTAPEQLKSATKNYYILNEGELGYNKMVLRELKQKSDAIALLIANNFMDYLDVINNNLEDYNNAVKETRIVQSLNDEYRHKIKIMQDNLLTRRTNRTTNNRKSYYEDQQIQNLHAWKKLFKIIFYILTITLAIALFISPSSLSISKKIIIIILLALYPFYILFIAKYVMKTYSGVMFLLPKNVYNDI